MHPTTTLFSSDLARIESHLLRLSAEDRALRFSSATTSDAVVRDYASRIRFGNDVVIGCVDPAGTLVALCHGCVYRARDMWYLETAFSVDLAMRRRGLGAALMRDVMDQALAMGIDAVVGFCASRNLAMRRIFEHADMRMTRDQDEIHAHGELHAGRRAGIALAQSNGTQVQTSGRQPSGRSTLRAAVTPGFSEFPA